MRVRIAITIFTLCVYLGLFIFYIFELTRIDWHYANLLYNYMTAGAILFVLLDWKSGFVNRYHEQLNLVFILSVLVNYGIIILLRHGVFKDDEPIPMFYTFDGGFLAVTLSVFANAIRTKLFNYD